MKNFYKFILLLTLGFFVSFFSSAQAPTSWTLNIFGPSGCDNALFTGKLSASGPVESYPIVPGLNTLYSSDGFVDGQVTGFITVIHQSEPYECNCTPNDCDQYGIDCPGIHFCLTCVDYFPVLEVCVDYPIYLTQGPCVDYSDFQFYRTVTTPVVATNPSDCSSMLLTTTTISAAYVWEVTDDVNNPARWRVITGKNSSSISITIADLQDLNISANLFARFKDPTCYLRLSNPTDNSFRIYLPPPTFTVTTTTPTCYGGDDGKITIGIPSGGLTGYLVKLFYNGNLQYLEPMSAGSFPYEIDKTKLLADSVTPLTGIISGNWTVWIQNNDSDPDKGDCSADVIKTVPVTLKILPTVSSDTPVRCFDESNGSVTLSIANGTPGFTYTIDNVAALPAAGSTARVPIFTNLSGGTHSVKVNDANCQSDPLTITIRKAASLLIPSITVNQEISCFETNNGILTANATGGQVGSGYSYSWNTSSTNHTISGLTDIQYTATVTDAYGCQKPASYTFIRPAKLNFDIDVVKNISCSGYSDAKLEVTNILNEVGTVTYGWTRAGETDNFLDGVSAGNSEVTVLDGNGCSRTKSITLANPPGYTVNIVPLSNFNGSKIKCNKGSDGEISAVVRDANNAVTTAQHYTWLKNGQPFDNGATLNSIDQLEAGNYKVMIAYGSGCFAENAYLLSDPSAVVATVSISSSHNGYAISCPGASSGSLHATGSNGTPGPYTYLWYDNTTSADLTGKPQGSYSVTVKDINGCPATSSGVLNDPPPINPVVSVQSNYFGLPIKCFNSTDGKLHATTTGGAGAISFVWNTGVAGADLESIGAGTYAVTATDANNCSITSAAKVIVNPTPVIASVIITSDHHGQPISCFNASDGSLNTSATGGTNSFMYSWSTGATGSGLSGIPAGTYTVTASDMNGCSDTKTTTLINPDVVKVSISDFSEYNGYGVHCKNDNDGFIEASAEGGTGNYNFLWIETSETTFRIADLSAGTYTVSVTDENGCSDNEPHVITEPDLLDLSLASSKNISCFDGSDGEMIFFASGGAGNYQYSINTIDWQSEPLFNTLKANIPYKITAQDQNGCSETLVQMLTQPSQFDISFEVEEAFCADPRGKAVATVTGGVGSYTFQWKDVTGASIGLTSSIEEKSAGVYSLLIHDGNSCPFTETIGISSTDGPQVNVKEITSAKCSHSSDGSSLLEVIGGQSPVTFLWPNGQTTPEGSGLAKGLYNVTITDVDNCITVIPVEIPAPDVLDISVVESTMPACFGDCNGKIKVGSQGGVGSYEYSWNSQAGEVASNLCVGSHTVTVVDGNGCSLTESFTLDQPELLQLQIKNRTLPLCFESCDGSIEVEALGGNGNYQFAWTSGSNLSLANNICAGEYTIKVTDSKNCMVERTIPLGQPSQLQVRLIKNQAPICHDGCNGTLEVQAYGGTGSYDYLWSNGSTIANLSGLCSSDYHVTINDDNTCSISRTYSIDNPPALSIDLGGSITLCAGQTHLLDAGTSWRNYAWGSNTGVAGSSSKIIIKDPGQYWVKLLNNEGCIAQDTFLLETSTDFLKANLFLTTEAMVGDTIVIIDISWPLPENISWEFPTTMDKLLDLGEIIYGRFDDPGVYEIKLNAQIGECNDEMKKIITILPEKGESEDGRLGLKEEFVKEFLLHPNPNDGNFQVSIELADESPVALSVWSTVTSLNIGYVIKSGQKKYIEQFDLRPLSSGTYVMRLDHAKGYRTIRFIIN